MENVRTQLDDEGTEICHLGRETGHRCLESDRVWRVESAGRVDKQASRCIRRFDLQSAAAKFEDGVRPFKFEDGVRPFLAPRSGKSECQEESAHRARARVSLACVFL